MGQWLARRLSRAGSCSACMPIINGGSSTFYIHTPHTSHNPHHHLVWHHDHPLQYTNTMHLNLFCIIIYLNIFMLVFRLNMFDRPPSSAWRSSINVLPWRNSVITVFHTVCKDTLHPCEQIEHAYFDHLYHENAYHTHHKDM